MSTRTKPAYEFANFRLLPNDKQLLRDGKRVPLTPKAFDTLLLLLENHGNLVPKEEFLARLWPDSFVEEVALAHNISQLRKSLGDEKGDPRLIETVPKRGYRFVGVVRWIDGTDSHATGAAVAATTPGAASGAAEESAPVPTNLGKKERQVQAQANANWPRIILFGAVVILLLISVSAFLARRHRETVAARDIHSLAVLPLENLSGDPNQEYFSDGLTDELITGLAHMQNLRVIARTSMMQYKATRKPAHQIATELNVDGIVEGSVVRIGDRVRVRAQLIRGDNDEHVWAQVYERNSRDVLALQGELALDIAREIQLHVTPEQRAHLTHSTDSPEAYQLYLKGRYHWNQRTPAGVKKSIEFYQHAVELDPNFPLAYAGLADAYNFSNILRTLSPSNSCPEAKAAATKALVLDPRLAEAHTALALVKSHCEFDFPGAQAEFLHAIALNPNYANAHLFYSGAYLIPMNQHRDAIAEMKKALELDPLSPAMNNWMGMAYLLAGEYDEALQQLKLTVDLDPTFPLAHFFLSGLFEETGRYEDAIAENEKGALLQGETPEETGRFAMEARKALETRGASGYWRRNLELTLKAYEQAGTSYFAAIDVAAAYARVGDKDNAFTWLNKSYEDREGQDITLVASLPAFKSLHGDPRFPELLRRMGLPN